MTIPPSYDPQFWEKQAMALAALLSAIEAALRVLSETLPPAIQQAADLGLMREQHDTAGLRTAVRGGQALADIDHDHLERLEARVAALEARL